MSGIINVKERARKISIYCLGLILILSTLMLAPQVSNAAVTPLPSPGSPLIYDDFDGGGVFNQPWMNWYNQDGGTGTFSKTVVDSRDVGLFAQTPASASSWAKFQPWNETVNLVGYRYLNFTMKNPGFANARIRIVINDGSKNYTLANWVEVASTWTISQFDLDALVPTINKKKVKFEIWLRNVSGTNGEILIDDIFASTESSGTAPTITATSMTSNTGDTPNQNTFFTYKATYTDQDNEKPFAMQLVIDDTAYEMREANNGDTTYMDGKDYIYLTKLPVGSHSYYFRTTDTTSNQVDTALQSGPTVVHSEQIIDVVASQAGYSINDFKNAKVTSTNALIDTTYDVLDDTTVVSSGTMVYEGVTWDKHVYSIDLSSITSVGSNYTVRSNSISSFPFSIQTNIWDSYKDEMTAFYRIQRANVATSDVYPPGYSSIAPSAKVFHPAGHLDDASSVDGTQHYDLTGSWYDAGDYGKYAGNQWVGSQIALAYIRHADSTSVKYDNDSNGIPDLVDEAIFSSVYLIKWANIFNGEIYDIRTKGGFQHPHHATDNIPNTADDRMIAGLGVGGSAKAAGTLAATARAIHTAIAEGDLDSGLITTLTAFADECEAAAVVFYDYVVANPTGPVGSYGTRGGIANSKLLADVQLYLLTNDTDYKDAATTEINTLTFDDLASTNYWDMRPMSLAEFYPVADSLTQAHIQGLLKEQLDYFLSITDDTPYGVLNQFKNFGVNEPHASYLGDMMRYYELFGDPAALQAVLKGMYWIFGVNPWNISWVSGVGSDYVDYLHTRYDEGSNSTKGTGIVIPGAMVSGPNMKNTLDLKSVSPWYEDRPLTEDDGNQWRYNEFSVSIQAGLLYTIMGLSAMDSVTSPSVTSPVELPILSPIIGDYVRGNVTVFTGPATGLSAVEAKVGSTYVPMSVSGAVYSVTYDESATAPYATKRIDVRGTDVNGNHTHSSTHYTIAAPLPDPSTPMLYDDMAGQGIWGGSLFGTWVNWYTQNGGTASYTRTTEDGRSVAKFAQTPTSSNSRAKFQPWNDILDLSGYRFLNFMVKNPSSPDLRMRIELSDGVRTHNLTGGYVSVPTTWTNLQIDLDSLANPVNKKATRLSIWFSQSTGTYGEMFIDDITASNEYSGSAPTLTWGGVDLASGDEETEFTFNVTYTDVDNESPFAMELVLDGVVHYMEPVDVNDTTYSDGKAYQYTTKLPLGIHSYYFHTTDTSSDAVSTTVQTGPEVTDGSILFFDDFSDGNADGWTTTSGAWSVIGGEYSGQASSSNSYSIAGDSGWTDYTLEAKVKVTNNSNGNKDAGLVFRYTDTDNHYILYLKNNDRAGRKMELVKVVNGVKTILDYANPSVLPDTFHTYKIIANGDSIEVYQDNILILSATDSAHSSGKIGARVYANTKAIFDDITVTP
jgi:endoglucanase